MVEGLTPLPGRIDGDLERALDLRLAHKFVQPRRPERRVRAALFRQRLWRGDLQPGHVIPSSRAFQRTGRASSLDVWTAWQVTQRSVVLGGTDRQELPVGCSAASTDPFRRYRSCSHELRSPSGGELLQRSPNKLRRLYRSAPPQCAARTASSAAADSVS